MADKKGTNNTQAGDYEEEEHLEKESNPKPEDDEEDEEDLEDYEDDSEDDPEDGGASGDDVSGSGGEDAETAAQGNSCVYNAIDVNDQIFEELRLDAETAKEVQNAWDVFLKSSSTRDAVGEAIFAAIFEAQPSLQTLFKTPRAIMAMKFMDGMHQAITSLHEPEKLKVAVESLGFRHMEIEVTVQRTITFRDAISELMFQELGMQFTAKAREGLLTLINYMGGSFIFIRVKYQERLRILASSWTTANTANHEDDDGELLPESLGVGKDAGPPKKELAAKDDNKGGGILGFGKKDGKGDKDNNRHSGKKSDRTDDMDDDIFKNTSVPTTFSEMFMFNAAVMGFGDRPWMNEVLASFDTIVRNVSSSGRLQEECDVLALRISKKKCTSINLGEFKAVMLSSLRSLVPKDWNSAHEVAWSWLWEMIERMLKANLGRPQQNEKLLVKFFNGLDDANRNFIRRELYVIFFSIAPSGQEFFKQSKTRLDFIADKSLGTTLEIYRDPVKMVHDMSALGLRHVGYGVPVELFSPFVTAAVQTISKITDDSATKEAFRWSLGLVSRMLTRVIAEGSTIVMKAINSNSAKTFKKAIACAPRGDRATWMLNVQVGTQSISPLLWALSSGMVEVAKAILNDLLTIRADRDRYYYGMDFLFDRHPDIILRLSKDAPSLLETLFDGLIWRSRFTENGMRRVNYYIKYLVVDAEGGCSKAIEWLVEHYDPKIVCHPVFAMATDVIWGHVAFRAFLISKCWLIITLAVFIVGVSVFENDSEDAVMRYIILSCRLFTYLFSLCPMVYMHVKKACKDYRTKRTTTCCKIPLPTYLARWQDVVSLLLTFLLLLMLSTEPILQCLADYEGDFHGAGMFTQVCEQGESVYFTYTIFGLCAMFLYFLLTIDLSVFSTRVSAFVLICLRVASEVWLYILAMVFVIVTFACGISTLAQGDHSTTNFQSIPEAMLSLMQIATKIFHQSSYNQIKEEPALLITVVIYVIVSVTFLLNLLIAQMNCSYANVYEDMLGYARLNRGKIVMESMPWISKARWERFVAATKLDDCCEFGEGDVGVPGAIQVQEPAALNITTVDMIKRYGGNTSTDEPWPADEDLESEENDRLDRMEKMLEKAIKRLDVRGGKKGGSSMGTGSLHGSSGGGSLALGSESGSGMGSEH